MEEDTEERRKLRVKERRHYTEDCLQDDEIEGRRMFTVEDKVTSPAFTCTFVKEMKGEDFSLKYFQENGFEYPMLFKSKTNMGMRLPSHNFTCNDVRQCVGSRRILDVMDVTTQKDIEMTMKDWCRYFENPSRDKLLNVISLEFSHTKLENYVESPSVVRQVDWVDVVWPRHLKELQTEGTNSIEDMRYPKVQKYCLMSVKGCYTDFHIDFGGTSVWYHLLRGQKVFWLIPPTKRNFQLYEQWVLSGKQGDVFFGETVEKCDRVTLNEGDTFFIPTGWIHAVYTPVDALVFGGNFLHSYGIEKQLQIAQIEDATHVPLKFRYPFYREMLWYVLQRYVQCLLGVNHLTCNEDGDPVDAPRRNSSSTSRPSPAAGAYPAGEQRPAFGAPGDGSSFLDLSTLSPKPQANGNNPGSSPTMQAEDSMDSADEPGKHTYPPGHVHLTRREIDGIRMIIRWLQKLPANKKFVPDLVRDPDALLADAKRLVKEHKHDDPLLAVTDKPVLFWPESKKKSKPRVGGPPSGKHSSKGGGRGSDKDKNGARRRRTRCKKCEACLRADCGDCHFCKDMKKFGGPGRMKQSCISRQCMAPVLPHTACCMLCGRDGWEKGAPPQPCDQEACSSLMECSQCWEIVHPACLQERHPALRGAQGSVSDDLPNSWECPKCCRDGKPDQVKPRHTRGRVSKGPQDGRPDSECAPCGDAAGGSSPVANVNPALNLTLRPHEAAAAAAELGSSELDPCSAPAKKKIKTEGPQEPLEYNGMPLSDNLVQQVQPAASNGDISDEDMCKDNVSLDASALNRTRKDDYVRSCSRLTVSTPDKKPVVAKSSHDQIVQSMRGLHKDCEPEAAEAAALPLSIPMGEEFESRTESCDGKEDRKPTTNGGAADYVLSGNSHPGDLKLKMTLRDRGNLRKPRYVVRPAPLPEDLEKAKVPPAIPSNPDAPCYALVREAMLPVLRYLTPRELSQCQLVCKAWNRWCVEPGMWRRVDLSRRRVTAHALAGIVRRQPTCLDLAWTNVSAKQLSWLLPRLPHLKELGLSGCSAAAVVAALRSGVCPRLRSLDLSWVEGLGDQAVRDLVAPDARSKPRLLVEVRLAGCDISDVAVRLLGHQLPQLSRLDLSDCRGVTDMGIAVLGAAKASRLTALDVSRCANVSDTGLEALRRCSGLRHLDLRDCPQVTDSACRRFVAQSRLPVELKESKLIELAQP